MWFQETELQILEIIIIFREAFAKYLQSSLHFHFWQCQRLGCVAKMEKEKSLHFNNFFQSNLNSNCSFSLTFLMCSKMMIQNSCFALVAVWNGTFQLQWSFLNSGWFCLCTKKKKCYKIQKFYLSRKCKLSAPSHLAILSIRIILVKDGWPLAQLCMAVSSTFHSRHLVKISSSCWFSRSRLGKIYNLF